MNDWQQRVTALAGMALSGTAVQQIARSGQVQQAGISDTLIESVLNLNPSSTEDVYGSVAALSPGLRVLFQQLSNSKPNDFELTQYMVGMVHLARRLLSQPAQMQALGQQLEQVSRQYHEFGFERYRIVQSLASIYRERLSPLGRPIRINGNQRFLSDASNQHQIRALLLAGVRSAVLWQQVGGKRRHFLLSRQRMLNEVKNLLRATAR